MPRMNYGTLLENTVVLEAANLCFEAVPMNGSVAMCSAFAMPPITQCWSYQADIHQCPGFNINTAMAKGASPLHEFWWLCQQNQSNLPVCNVKGLNAERGPQAINVGGPNGPLLASMAALRAGKSVHLWLNDDGDRYGNVPPMVPSSASELPQTANHAATLLNCPPNGASVTAEGGAFPATIPQLQKWLAHAPANGSQSRLGFLDPDNYIEGPQASVSSQDHCSWLRALAAGCPKALSCMFFAVQNNPALPGRVATFLDDEIALFPRTLIFRRGNFLTGVKVRWPEDSIEDTVNKLCSAVLSSWQLWSIGGPGLTLYQDGVVPD